MSLIRSAASWRCDLAPPGPSTRGAGDPVEALRAITCIGADLVIEASGVPAVIPQAIEAARKAGRIVLVGIPTGPST